MTDTKKPRQRKKSTTVRDMLGLWDVTHQRVEFLREDLAAAEKELRAVEAFLEATAPAELERRRIETGITLDMALSGKPPAPPKRLTIEMPAPAPITDMDNGQ